MKNFLVTIAAVLMLSAPAFGQIQTSITEGATSIAQWHKQNVYDNSGTKVGQVDDLLVDRQARLVTLIVSVGGFLGVGDKHIAVAIGQTHHTLKDGQVSITIDTTKERLRAAPAFKYDDKLKTWVP